MIKLTNKLLSVVLICLALSMLVFWIQYISIQFDRDDSDIAGTLDRDFWIFGDDLTESEEVKVSEKYFSPLSVSIMLSGKGYTSEYNKNLTDTLYSTYKPLVEEVFSSNYVCKKSNENAWRKALEANDSVIIEYPSALPYPTIATFAGKNENFCEGEISSVKKLIIFSDGENSVTALSVDEESNYYSYLRKNENSPSLVYDFNSNNIVAYTVNKGFIEFVFNQNSNKISESLPFDYKLTKEAFSLPSILAENFIEDLLNEEVIDTSNSYFDIIEHEGISKIIDIFGINPHVMGYYADKSSGLVFVGEDLSLTVTPNGEIHYLVNDKDSVQITVSELINSPRKTFSSSEILTAVCHFLDRFSEGFFTSDSELILKNMTFSEKDRLFTFEFSHYFEKAEVLPMGKDASIKLTFSEEGLIYAEILPLTLTRLHSVNTNENLLIGTDVLPTVAINMFSPEKPTELSLTYVLNEFDSALHPLWSIRKAGVK